MTLHRINRLFSALILSTLMWCLLSLSCLQRPLHAEWLKKAQFNINPRKTDSFVVRGRIDARKLESALDITVKIGTFSESISTEDFTERRNGRILRYRGEPGTSGITSLLLNLWSGRVIIKGRRLILSGLSRPAAVALTINDEEFCSIVALKQKGKRQQRGKRKIRQRLVRAGGVQRCLGSSMPILSQNSVLKDEDSQVLVEFNIEKGVTPTSLEVYRATKRGRPRGPVLATLFDNGSNGDAVSDDGILSGYLSVTSKGKGTRRFVVKAPDSSRRREGELLSPGFEVNVVNELEETSSFLEEYLATQNQAGQIWKKQEQIHGDTLKARVNTVRRIRRLGPVVDAFVAANQQDIDIQYAHGVSGALVLSVRPDEVGRQARTSEAQIRRIIEQTSSTVRQSGSQKVLLWDPGFFPGTSEAVSLAELFRVSKDPSFQVTFLEGSQASLESIESFTDYNIVIIVSHGFSRRDGTTGLSTDQRLNKETFERYKSEFQTGKLKGWYDEASNVGNNIGILPGYIRELKGRFNNSIIYAGACHSSQSSALPNAFRAKGAASYLGFSDAVDSSFARDKALSLFCNLLVEGDDIGRAYSNVTPKIEPLSRFPNRPRAQFVLDGSRSISIAGTSTFDADKDLTLNPSLLSLFPESAELLASSLSENTKGLPCLEYRWTNPGRVGTLIVDFQKLTEGTSDWLESGQGTFVAKSSKELGEELSDKITVEVRTKTDRREIGSAEGEVKIECEGLEKINLTASATRVTAAEKVLLEMEPVGDLEGCEYKILWRFSNGRCGVLSDGRISARNDSSFFYSTSNTASFDPANCARLSRDQNISILAGIVPQDSQDDLPRPFGEIEIEVVKECLDCKNTSPRTSFLRNDEPEVCELRETCCEDGQDNDLDGLIDCDDPDCSEEDFCEECEPGEYPATKVIKSGSTEACDCYAYAFIQWPKELSNGATGVTGVYDWLGGGQLERTVPSSSPYSNEFTINGVPLTPAEGTNWIYANGGSSFDFNPDRCAPDCSGTLNAVSNLVTNPRVRITCP